MFKHDVRNAPMKDFHLTLDRWAEEGWELLAFIPGAETSHRMNGGILSATPPTPVFVCVLRREVPAILDGFKEPCLNST